METLLRLFCCFYVIGGIRLYVNYNPSILGSWRAYLALELFGVPRFATVGRIQVGSVTTCPARLVIIVALAGQLVNSGREDLADWLLCDFHSL